MVQESGREGERERKKGKEKDGKGWDGMGRNGKEWKLRDGKG